jgi:hypothetical protein
MDGYADRDMLTIEAMGGRLVNTGLMAGNLDLTVGDNAQAILATDGADFILNENSRLEIIGGDAKVGFDGDSNGPAVMLMDEGSELRFSAEEGRLGQIREFYSGAFDSPAGGVSSGVNLGGSKLVLDLSGIAGTGAFSTSLINVDEIIGRFGELEMLGLGADRDAVVTIDYDNDSVLVTLGEAGLGTGATKLETLGDESSAMQDDALWAALTNGHGIYADDPASSIPADPDEVTEL